MSLDFYRKRKGGQGFMVVAGLVVALLIGLLAWAGANAARRAAPAGVTAPTQAILASPTGPPPASATPPPADTPAASAFLIRQAANGLTLQLVAVSRAGETLTADLCYPLPTPSQAWQLGDRPNYVTLQAGASTIGMAGAALLSWQNDPAGAPVGRCDHVYFTVPAALDLSHFSIHVARLMTAPSEGPDCAAVQDKLNRAGTGIVIACHPGAYSFGWEVVNRPVTLTSSAANQLALDAFSDIVTGPWVFTASLPAAAPSPPGPAASATAADPRASGAHPDTLTFTRMDDQTGAASYVILPLDCLARPGGCAKPPAPSIPLPPTQALAAASWSPDGAAFAFLAGVDGRFDIYRVNADGSGLVDLTPSAAVRNSVAWAPDGAHIVYSVQTGDPGSVAGARADLYLLDIATPGAQPVRLTDTPELKSDPSFAPGGRYLAFGAQVQDTWGIYVLSLDDAVLPLTSLDAPGVTRITPARMDAAGAV